MTHKANKCIQRDLQVKLTRQGLSNGTFSTKSRVSCVVTLFPDASVTWKTAKKQKTIERNTTDASASQQQNSEHKRRKIEGEDSRGSIQIMWKTETIS